MPEPSDLPADPLAAAGPRISPFPRARAGANAAWRLSDAQVAAWQRDGFVGPVPLLSADQVHELRARLDAIVQRLPELRGALYEVEHAFCERPGEVVCHFLGGWLVDPWLHELVYSAAATVPAAQLLGISSLRLWHDQAFVKPARHPGHVPWHQDYAYWTRVRPARHITVNVMLDDADLDNGCLEFVPGSHRWGDLPTVPFDAPRDAILAALTPRQRESFVPRPVPLRAGEATLHHSHTLHGSAGNGSDRPRRALVINYMAVDTRCASAVPLLRGVPPIAVGAVIDGAHFPIVLDRGATPALRSDSLGATE